MRYGKFLFLLGFVFLIGLASAHHHDYYKEKYSYSDYYPKYDRVVTETTWTYYDNDDRYSTYDYRHGYSYRATRDYNERKVREYRSRYDADYRYKYGAPHSYHDYHDYQRYDHHYGHGSSHDEYYEVYVPHLREYEGRTCYTHPPADRLFYIAC